MSATGTLRRWTAAEDDVIRAAWMTRPLPELAADLGRRVSEVSTRARAIGVRRRRERWRATPAYAPSRGRAVVRYDRPEGGGKPVAVLEHRDVASRALGRPLASDEIVPHVDLDPTNNDPSNLHVLRDMSAHLRAHRSLDGLVAPLLATGAIHYDGDLGAYVLGANP